MVQCTKSASERRHLADPPLRATLKVMRFRRLCAALWLALGALGFALIGPAFATPSADAVRTAIEPAYCLASLEAGFVVITETCATLGRSVDAMDAAIRSGTIEAPSGTLGDVASMRALIRDCDRDKATMAARVDRLRGRLTASGLMTPRDPPEIGIVMARGRDERAALDRVADECSASCIAAMRGGTDNLSRCIGVCIDHRGLGEAYRRAKSCPGLADAVSR